MISFAELANTPLQGAAVEDRGLTFESAPRARTAQSGVRHTTI
jgi:hypothetical protein